MLINSNFELRMRSFDRKWWRRLMNMRKENFSRMVFFLSALFSQVAIDLNLGFFKVFKCEN
jgi:hypothetical protein